MTENCNFHTGFSKRRPLANQIIVTVDHVGR